MENNLKNMCVYAFLAVHLKLTQYCYCKSIALQFKKSNIPPLMTLEQSINKHWLDLALLVITQCRDVTCRSAAQSSLALCDPMDCSTPGFPVLDHLLEFAQTHIH